MGLRKFSWTKLLFRDYIYTEADSFRLEIMVEEITPFKNHPFKVVDDPVMEELTTSIRLNSVPTPVLVRPMGDVYEMISGHRRMHAAIKAGLTTIPAIIRDMEKIIYRFLDEWKAKLDAIMRKHT